MSLGDRADVARSRIEVEALAMRGTWLDVEVRGRANLWCQVTSLYPEFYLLFGDRSAEVHRLVRASEALNFDGQDGWFHDILCTRESGPREDDGTGAKALCWMIHPEWRRPLRDSLGLDA
jgi:hypothetical protein